MEREDGLLIGMLGGRRAGHAHHADYKTFKNGNKLEKIKIITFAATIALAAQEPALGQSAETPDLTAWIIDD
jgi:hypothetical protein